MGKEKLFDGHIGHFMLLCMKNVFTSIPPFLNSTYKSINHSKRRQERGKNSDENCKHLYEDIANAMHKSFDNYSYMRYKVSKYSAWTILSLRFIFFNPDLQMCSLLLNTV